MTMPSRPEPGDLRASDTDRERVTALLGEALADGRLSHEEHSERTSAALSARTLGELARLTTDLVPLEQQPLRLDGGQSLTALFTTVERHGRWVVPATVTCTAAFGEVVIDMTEALLQDRHVVLSVYALFGRVRLIVPPGVEVIMNGTDILGRQRGGTARRVPTSSDVPVIEVRGYVAASEVLARTPPRPRRWLPWRRPQLRLGRARGPIRSKTGSASGGTGVVPPGRYQSYLTVEYALSFHRACSLRIERIVPERDRITSECVVAPPGR